MLDRLKSMLGGSGPPKAVPSGPASQHPPRRVATGQPFNRQSNGLDQFFSAMRDRGTLSLLDFAGASQENISFITSMGHRLASEDLVMALEQTFGDSDVIQNQSEPRLVDEFVSENLNFEADSFDGALVWDSLQFLSPHLLQLTVDRLYEALRADACLLAFFNADEKLKQIPVYQYRIAANNQLSLTPRGSRAPAQFFNNRSIEKLFHRFQSVKFFLARDHLREIIVRR